MERKTRGIWIGLGVLGAGIAFGQSTERVSVSSAGAQGNAGSGGVSMSADGRWVAFSSDASTLAAGDAVCCTDVFVRDRQAGTTDVVDIGSGGTAADAGGQRASISADGRYVAFLSGSTNLVPGGTNGFQQVYVHDRWTGATERVSTDSNGVEGNRDSDGWLAISADGRHVLFESDATNLVPGDTNDTYDVFVHDRQTGATQRLSVDANGVEGDLLSGGAYNDLALSADGRYAAFKSYATNLVPGDTNGQADIFVRDRQAGTIERVDVSTAGSESNGEVGACTISGDGRFVAFTSAATNLVPGDTNGKWDGFFRDRQLGITSRVSEGPGGGQADGHCNMVQITPDGRYVAFTSDATNLAPGNPAQQVHAYLHDRVTGTTIQADVGGQGGTPNGFAWWGDLAISADGQQVGFSSPATNLVPEDTNGFTDVFVHEFGPNVITAFCFGDGSGAPCPCGNSGITFRGCENSVATGGAVLVASGLASLGNDTLRITSSRERAQAFSIVLQGDAPIAAETFGDGLRCVGGNLLKLYSRNASQGALSVPQAFDASVSVRSAVLGDPLHAGVTRVYQVYYRDPAPGFCPSPVGNTWNIGNALSLVWNP
jgi:Tol biopolymer transport system component